VENLHTIGKLFCDRMLRVPDYWRGYGWEEQQWQDFVEDLELLSGSQEHFFGLLILQAWRHGPKPRVEADPHKA